MTKGMECVSQNFQILLLSNHVLHGGHLQQRGRLLVQLLLVLLRVVARLLRLAVLDRRRRRLAHLAVGVLVLVLGHVQTRVDHLRDRLDLGAELLLDLVQRVSLGKIT